MAIALLAHQDFFSAWAVTQIYIVKYGVDNGRYQIVITRWQKAQLGLGTDLPKLFSAHDLKLLSFGAKSKKIDCLFRQPLIFNDIKFT